MLRLTWHPLGPRVHVLGHRLHHGVTGLALLALGAALMLHDKADFPWTRDKD